jgi:sugar phosphate isomerase/epimerase
LWDSHHTWKRGGEDPVATWAAIAPHVVHVHVKDSVSRPSAKHPYTYVVPGSGEFPAAPLMDCLRREFSASVSLEWERQWHPYLSPLDEALTAATRNGWW